MEIIFMLGILFTVVGLLMAGVFTERGKALSVMLFGICGCIGVIFIVASMMHMKDDYYKERIPNLQEQIDAYEVQVLEEKLELLKEK